MKVRIARVKGTFGTTANLQTKGRHVVTFVDDLYKWMIHNLFQDIGESEVGALWHSVLYNFSMHQINVVVSENDVKTEMIHSRLLSSNSSS